MPYKTNHKNQTTQNGYFEQNRTKQLQNRFHAFMEEELLNNFYSNFDIQESIEQHSSQIADKKISPYTAGKMVLEKYKWMFFTFHKKN